MIIKRFKSMLSQSRSTLAFKYFHSQLKHLQGAFPQNQDIQEPQNILAVALHDSRNYFKNYSQVKRSFQNALIKQKYQLNSSGGKDSKRHRKVFQQTLDVISEYPLFQLDSQSLKAFHKLINDNIHAKDNQLLQKCLIFSIVADPHVVNSPVFVQFVRFYVKDFLQLLRAQLSIDLIQENVVNTIKLFLFRTFQRGFLPRSPGYSRQLYINNHAKMLHSIIQNHRLHSSLMLKRINFEYFTQIKQFYQREMSQNLYHQKNRILLQKLIKILPFLRKSYEQNIKIIQEQAQYLRQLYIKLFVVMQKPQLQNAVFIYDLTKRQQIHQEKQSQNKSLIQTYQNKVQKQLQQTQLQRGQNFSTEQLLIILINQQNLHISQIKIGAFGKIFLCRLSSVFFKRYFQKFLQLLHKQSSPTCLHTVFSQKFHQDQIYSELLLEHIAKFSEQKFAQKDHKIKHALVSSILKKDIKKIGNAQLLNLLKVYMNTQPSILSQNQACLSSSRVSLINFIFRFLSDHHVNLPFDSEFQQILNIIFLNQQQDLANYDFNDSEGNYPNPIYVELYQNLKKNLWKTKTPKLKDLVTQKYLKE